MKALFPEEHKQMRIDVFKGTALPCDDYKAWQKHRSFSSSPRAHRSVTISSQSAHVILSLGLIPTPDALRLQR